MSAPDWLGGLFAVLPTPMVAGGALDVDSLDRVVDHYLAGGASGLVPASIAGEGDRLDAAERELVIRRVAARARGRVPVVAAVLRADLDGALAQGEMAAACGADALLVKPPTASARATLDHFGTLAHALRLPMVLLDYPKDGPLLPPALIAELVEAQPKVCGIKLEDEPTAAKMAALRVRLGARLRLFGGLGGAHCLEELEHGADGFFTGCPRPELLVEALARFRAGEHAAAAAAFDALRDTIRREREHPAGWIAQRKAVLCELGVLREAATRPPVRPPAAT